MAEPGDKAPPSGLEKPMAGAKRLIELGQWVVGLGGALVALISRIREDRWTTFIVGLGLCGLSAGWWALSRWWRRRRRQMALPFQIGSAGKAYLRGPLPFEKGEALLGREADLGQILAKVTSSEFRFGYISGEAGSGKTSLLRAGLLSKSEEAGLWVIYAPKPGVNPAVAIAQALLAERAEPLLQTESSLRELLATARSRSQGRRLLIVCDQFEEFFVANRTLNSRKPFIREVRNCLEGDDPNLAFFFALRKEFVADLQDFSSAVPQPLDTRFSHRLRNWEPNDALAVLRDAARHDCAPFAEALQEEIVQDLEQAGEVRPVELQIVAKHLLSHRIFDLAQYKMLGGAAGILKSYVRSVIEPEDTEIPELERQVARHLLRALCDGASYTKRPTGLQMMELESQIRASLEAGGLGDLTRSSGQFRRALEFVLDRCMKAYLVLQEDERAFNLVHDYLVRPILDATSDIEPINEKANRLLDNYLEQQRRDPKVTLRRGDYRFIKNYAAADRMAEPLVLRLLARTRRRRIATAAGIFLCALVIGLWVVPPRLGFDVTRRIAISRSNWLFQNGGVAISFGKGQPVTVWRLDRPWEQRIQLPMDIRIAKANANAAFLCGVSKHGNVYVWRASQALRRDALPAVRLATPPGDQEDRIDDFWLEACGFSPTGEWTFGRGYDGKVYLWRPGAASSPMEPYFQIGSLARLDFSPSGKFISALTADGALTIAEVGAPNRRATLSTRLAPTRGLIEGTTFWKLMFSNDDRWLVATGEDKKLYVFDLRAFPTVTTSTFPLPLGEEPYDAVFDPFSRWLFVGSAGGQLYSWRVGGLLPSSAAPLLPARSLEIPFLLAPRVQFSTDGEWIAVNSTDRGFFIWNLGRDSGPEISATLAPEKLLIRFEFGPKGDRLIGSTYTGSLYSWKIGARPILFATRAIGETAMEIRWCLDGEHYFLSSTGAMFWSGFEGGEPEEVFRGEGPVQTFAVTPDRKQLVVFQPRQILFLKRRFSVWRVPVYSFLLSDLVDRAPEW